MRVKGILYWKVACDDLAVEMVVFLVELLSPSETDGAWLERNT